LADRGSIYIDPDKQLQREGGETNELVGRRDRERQRMEGREGGHAEIRRGREGKGREGEERCK
jgi:hypothetical protein